MQVNKIILFFLFISTSLAGLGGNSRPVFFEDNTIVVDSTLSRKEIIRTKITASCLAVALGPFGMHRLYLGTTPKIPIFYSLTLGGFGILPLTDLIAIIGTRNIEQYHNNQKIVMWVK